MYVEYQKFKQIKNGDSYGCLRLDSLLPDYLSGAAYSHIIDLM